MKESIAIGMCHSKREAGCTYDRRTSVERKRQALSFVHHQINRFENDEEREDDEEQRSVPEAATPFELGQFVGSVCPCQAEDIVRSCAILRQQRYTATLVRKS